MWQRGWLEGGALAEQLGYWKEQLRGATGVLELPADYQRSPVKSWQGEEGSFEFDAGSTEALGRAEPAGRRHLIHDLLAGVQAILWRYARQADISIGTPIANRNQEEIEGLIGFFVNMLVMRIEVRGDESFLEHLRRVREMALEHTNTRMSRSRSWWKNCSQKRDTSRTPLFQVTFALQNASPMSLELQGLEASRVGHGAAISEYDLSIEAYEAGPGLGFGLRYDAELFAPETIERMGSQLVELLLRIGRNPAARIADLTTIGAGGMAASAAVEPDGARYGAGKECAGNIRRAGKRRKSLNRSLYNPAPRLCANPSAR